MIAPAINLACFCPRMWETLHHEFLEVRIDRKRFAIIDIDRRNRPTRLGLGKPATLPPAVTPWGACTNSRTGTEKCLIDPPLAFFASLVDFSFCSQAPFGQPPFTSSRLRQTTLRAMVP